MGFTANRYVRTTGANQVEDLTKAATWSDLATTVQGAHVSDPAATAGCGKTFVAFFLDLVKITAAGDLLTTYTPGFAGAILSVDFVVHDPVTTGSKAATINLEIGTTDVTGGVVTLTSADCTPMGKEVAGTAVTDNDTFSNTDTISIEASSVTAFAEGSGWLIIGLRNADTVADVQANNAAIDTILSRLEALELLASS